jgi:rubrerythrin
MPFNFNADEIFKIAQDIEENGRDFYKRASEEIADSSYKNLLSGLSKMEVAHYNTFSKMRDSLTEKEKQPAVFDPNDESVQYLKALADMSVFYDKKIDMTNIESILKTALTMEKDSIAFYVGMTSLVPERLGKNKIQDIIEEEKKHVVLLTGELTKLKK